MRALTAAELLGVWEQGSMQAPTERALTLLEAACPDLGSETLARFSIGRRDGLLLLMRESTFGPRVEAVANCAGCGEQLELNFSLEDIRVSASTAAPIEPTTLVVDDYELRFRLPDSLDLLAVTAENRRLSARELLVERCLLSARREETETPATLLPEQILGRMEEEMSKLDAQAHVLLAIQCPGCHEGWRAAFDILGFFWSEINSWARRLLGEVHTLASHYGWREADILEMSAVRREIYLNMISI